MAVVTRDQLSHNPRVAAQQRVQAQIDADRRKKQEFHEARAAAIEAERARNQERRDKRQRERDEAKRERGRAYGRQRDQIATCYKQHVPPQIRFADQMVECSRS